MFKYTVNQNHGNFHPTEPTNDSRAFLHMKWIRQMLETNNLNFKYRSKVLAAESLWVFQGGLPRKPASSLHGLIF